MIPQQSELHFLGSHHCSHFTTRLLAAFSQRYKEVTISLNITNRKSLQEQLTNNEPDLVIMSQPPESVEVESEVFMVNLLVIIAPANHSLANEHNIPLEHLKMGISWYVKAARVLVTLFSVFLMNMMLAFILASK